MTDYTAPTRDMDFVLREVIGASQLSDFEKYSHVDMDGMPGLLDEAGRFFAEVVAPTNRIGDEQGSVRQDDGSVKTPDGFIDMYSKLVDAGWGAVPFDPEYGGAGYPWVIGLAIQEMLTSANMAFSLGPLLTQGAIHLLESHADESQRNIYLPRMITGEWSGTMNLTEPQAGSDVGALTCKAQRNDDGSYAITGQKIFITWGEHDLVENIIHLVLARTPDASPGTRGISVFIVPKFLVNDDGSLGEHNSLECVSLEHKMGIHASPTAVMSFDGATGYLIGEEQTGMASMFTMMNSARLSVGLEGLAVSERSFQQAAQYATDRVQGGRADLPKGEKAPIIEHPDVRRMLLTMQSHIEAMRGLCYLNALELDIAEGSPDAEVRERAAERADILTPMSKGWCTDLGNEMTSLGVQVHGGMGFIEETGSAQHYRDIRIGAIYEGTNGIQALDLIGRKLPIRGGAAVMELLDEIVATADSLDGDLSDLGKPLTNGVNAVRESTLWIVNNIGDAAMAGATPFLRLFSTVVGGWMMARQAAVAAEALANGASGDDQAFYEAKLLSSRFFLTQLLPSQMGLAAMVTGGDAEIMAWMPPLAGRR